MLGRTPGNIRVVTPLKNGVMADFKVTEKMLHYFIQKAHQRKTLVHPRIVISVPWEQIKIKIGSAHALDEPLTMEIKGRSLIEGVPKTVTVDDSEIRGALSECVSTFVSAIT